MRPVWLAGLYVEAMHKSAKINDDQQTVLDRNAADRAVHCFFELELAVGVVVFAKVVPNSGGVLVHAGEIAILFHNRLIPLVRNRLGRIGQY